MLPLQLYSHPLYQDIYADYLRFISKMIARTEKADFSNPKDCMTILRFAFRGGLEYTDFIKLGVTFETMIRWLEGTETPPPHLHEPLRDILLQRLAEQQPLNMEGQ